MCAGYVFHCFRVVDVLTCTRCKRLEMMFFVQAALPWSGASEEASQSESLCVWPLLKKIRLFTIHVVLFFSFGTLFPEPTAPALLFLLCEHLNIVVLSNEWEASRCQ